MFGFIIFCGIIAKTSNRLKESEGQVIIICVGLLWIQTKNNLLFKFKFRLFFFAIVE